MNLDYLIHLAGKGAVDIHPGGWKATLALLEALDLQAGDYLLEIGCGTGGTIMRLLQNIPLRVYGIDILPEMLSTARERLHFASNSEKAYLVQSNAAALPFPNGWFDKIFAESVIGFQDTIVIQKMLGEIQRVLKPNGLFVANEAVWRAHIDPQVVAEINRTCEADFGLRQATDQAWDIDDWQEAIEAAGFHIHSVNLIGEHLTGLAGFDRKMVVKEPLASRLLTRLFQVRSYLSPRLVAQHVSYRKRLRKHKEDGNFIEDRLFILQKI